MHRSYSQIGQDRWIAESVFPGVTDGFFVEIGAADGEHLSNSRLLEDLGWSGIAVDPFPTSWSQRRCQLFREVLDSAAGRSVTFREAGMYGGVDEYLGKWKDKVATASAITLTTTTLDDLLARAAAPPYIHYLSLDTEGSELAILQTFPFATHTIGALTIEHNFEEPKRTQICELLQRHGYRRVASPEMDDWYLHADLAAKPSALRIPDVRIAPGAPAGTGAGAARGPAHTAGSGRPPEYAQALARYQSGDLRGADELCMPFLRATGAAWYFWHLAALIAHRAGDARAAAQRIAPALAAAPAEAEPWIHAAEIFRTAGQTGKALAAAQRAVQLAPRQAAAHNNLGLVLRKLDRKAEAMRAFDRARQLDPKHAKAHYNLGRLLDGEHRQAEALACFDAALRAQPDYPRARIDRAMVAAQLCDWTHAAEDLAQLRTLLARAVAVAAGGRRGAPAPTPTHAVRLAFTPAEQRQIASLQAQTFLAESAPLRERLAFRHAPRTAGARIRVGYLSADFRNHPCAHLMRGVYGAHDRARFEVFAYSYGPDDGSDYRRRVVSDCDHFVDLSAADTEQAARRIHADGIDVLVDITGYTRSAWSQLAAVRAARVSVNFLGYPGTMGDGLMDYILTDAVVSPPGTEGDFSEKLVRLPHSFMPTDRSQEIAEVAPSRAEEGLPDDAVVLCAFNKPYKLEAAGFARWMRILQRAPRAVLWLQVGGRDEAVIRARLQRVAADAGVDPARLRFCRFAPTKAGHLARLAHADLFLDSFVYTAHTGAVDALWAGVPFLTCPGAAYASRVGASLLTSLGLPELIAGNLEVYEELAVALATDPARLAALRGKLAQNRLTTPLFDTQRYVRDLESAYEAMLAWA